ncbi:polymer-forming cytoskeletal protein [Maricaulaceae bacterium EIL42A08]|nr:polymer-forming cytoskeletal protein [Maricaulaceae bacterium EIL42A08]
MKSNALSILSNDLVVKGSIVSEGEVQLDGKVEGDVRATSLTIGEEATVKGEVIAENVVIRGRVEGSVRARQVQLASTARVEGDVIHASLAIESGAYFDGHCKRSSDPLADTSSTKIEDKPAAAPKAAAPSAPPPSSGASAASTGNAKKAVANDPFATKS